MTSFLFSFFISAAVSLVTGLYLVPYLRKIKAGQSIRRDGPVWHMSKEGTPTMGGLIFIVGTGAAVIGIGMAGAMKGDFLHLFILAFSLIFAAIGFLDDYEKLKKKQNLGLTALQKFLLQLLVSVTFVSLLRYFGYITPRLYIPFLNITVTVPIVAYMLLAAFIIVGTVNAVNITDGVDGLVTGVTIPVALFFTAVALAWGQYTVGIFSAALSGALIAFLFFNFNPAKIFMGDTGALFLGGAICALAFSLDMPLVLLPIGIVYVVETLSDIIQIAYFKMTHGKRIFKMAPLHHHFEMCGWSEKKLFSVFSAVSLIFAIITFIAVKGRY
jgi:phospho-N-acetylmuramoyl-pentapeptide-transferase